MTLLVSLRAVLVGTLLVVLLAFVSCSSSEAEGQVVQVRPRAAVELIVSGDYVVIDVRSMESFQAGHVRGARHLPFATPEFADRVETLDPGEKYLVYSRTGEQSSAAAEMMVAGDLDRVVDAGAFGPLAIAGAPLSAG